MHISLLPAFDLSQNVSKSVNQPVSKPHQTTPPGSAVIHVTPVDANKDSIHLENEEPRQRNERNTRSNRRRDEQQQQQQAQCEQM
jgi:hypothetical protein